MVSSAVVIAGRSGRRLAVLLPVQRHRCCLLTGRSGRGVRFQSSHPKPNTSTTSTTNGSTTTSTSSSSRSVVGFASEYFANLRWHAAKALTASLSSEEQKDLLNRYDIGSNQKAEQEQEEEEEEKSKQQQQHSIAEAVAAARAEDLRHHKEKWDREREQILQEAKEAAEARVENDLAIQQRRLAFQQWEQQLQQHKQEQKEQEQQEQQQEEEARDDENPNNHVHPVLGRCVYDFGYKRVHVIAASTLSSIPVWEKQRTYRHDRAKLMANDKLKTLHLGLPGVIAIHEDLDGQLSILDGQHRVGMMTILGQKKEKKSSSNNNKANETLSLDDLDLDHVLVEVYPQSQEQPDHAQDLFQEVNKSEPVKLIDMPGVVSKQERKIINDAAAAIQKRYPEMFKPNQNCRSPHLNIDNLRDALFSSDVFSRMTTDKKSSKSLQEWILQQNEILKVEYNREDDDDGGGVNNNKKKKKPRASPTALAKARKYDFYLGLGGMGWLLH